MKRRKTNRKLGTVKQLRAARLTTVIDRRTSNGATSQVYERMPPKLRRLAAFRRLHELRSHAEIHDAALALGYQSTSLVPLAKLELLLATWEGK